MRETLGRAGIVFSVFQEVDFVENHQSGFFAGTDLFALDEDARAAVRAQKLGFVFQSFQLLANLTALENVMLPLELQGRSDARMHATEMLRRVGLGERLRHYPKVLSGGEQQRVALARALASEPALVLLDEPLSAVDVSLRSKLLDEILEAQIKANIPFVYVTHNEAEVARLSGQHITLKSGHLA